jgi:cobalt-zinc-cadmium efflux system outer membrane protein
LDPDTLRVTLDRAVELALAGRPALQAAANRVRAAEAASRQARAWRNPQAIVDVEGFGGDRSGFDEAEVTVGVSGDLDVFGRAKAGGRVADATLQAERARRLSAHRRVEDQTRLAFHDVLASREQLRIADMILDITADTRGAILSEVEAGKTAKLRGIQAETTLEAARLRRQTARTRSEITTTRLSRLLAGTASPARPLAAEGDLRNSLPPLDPEALREELISRHPDIATDLWMAEVQKMRGRQIGRERWPDLGFLIGYRRNRASEASDWVGGLSAELPLLDRSQGAAHEARRLESAARDEARETALRLMGELEQGLEAGRAAASLLDRYDTELLPRAEEAMRLARLGYEEGKFGYLDLMDAQRALALSRGERAEALISLDRALTDLEVLLGRTLTPSSEELED